MPLLVKCRYDNLSMRCVALPPKALSPCIGSTHHGSSVGPSVSVGVFPSMEIDVQIIRIRVWCEEDWILVRVVQNKICGAIFLQSCGCTSICHSRCGWLYGCPLRQRGDHRRFWFYRDLCGLQSMADRLPQSTAVVCDLELRIMPIMLIAGHILVEDA